MKRAAVLLCASLLAAGCGQVPGSINKAAPRAEASAERSLASYLHDLSPKLEGVSRENARLEHYSIPTRSGAVLDAWVRRPPGEVGQPLVLVFTPYYGGGDPSHPANATGEPDPLVSAALIPRGYAVGWVSVGGTGHSTGCFHNGGRIEREQSVDALEYLAAQPWSNGAVGVIGASYAGKTANGLFLEAPPALKTVVPMVSVTDEYRFSFNNGMHRSANSLYTQYTLFSVGLNPVGIAGGNSISDPPGMALALAAEACPEQAQIQAAATQSTATGDKVPAFWDERDMIELVRATPERPRPSMFFIHGLQDANVDPQHADGFIEAVQATGVPLHLWLGQWGHVDPEPSTGGCPALERCRGDFYEVALVAWFDQFLKGVDTGILDAPMLQTQADDHVWRHENSWPGDEVKTLALHPAAGGVLGAAAGNGTASYMDAAVDGAIESRTQVRFVSEPLPQGLRLTGLPRLQTVATASGPRAGLVATLLEQRADATLRYLNFAAHSLNHIGSLHAARTDIRDLTQEFGIHFFPQDNVLQPGSRLVLVIGATFASRSLAVDDPPLRNTAVGTGDSRLLGGGPNLLPVGLGAEVTLDLAKTVLTLPVNGGNRVEPLSWLD